LKIYEELRKEKVHKELTGNKGKRGITSQSGYQFIINSAEPTKIEVLTLDIFYVSKFV
jgi:hypothetical protein